MIETEVVLPAGTIKRVHVDMHRIKANTKDGTDLPVLTVQAQGGPYKAHEVWIDGPSRMVYHPADPLSCGARCWLETHAQIGTLVRGTVREPYNPTNLYEPDKYTETWNVIGDLRRHDNESNHELSDEVVRRAKDQGLSFDADPESSCSYFYCASLATAEAISAICLAVFEEVPS